MLNSGCFIAAHEPHTFVETLRKLLSTIIQINQGSKKFFDLLTGRAEPFSSLNELEQVGVNLVLQRRAHAVRRARVNFERRVLDELGR